MRRVELEAVCVACCVQVSPKPVTVTVESPDTDEQKETTRRELAAGDIVPDA
ncbi:MAG: hypothetical protein LC674_03340 [Actinobacteria bacterium]|nr:hypothetical protein [Actinomycetota bacterium]